MFVCALVWCYISPRAIGGRDVGAHLLATGEGKELAHVGEHALGDSGRDAVTNHGGKADLRGVEMMMVVTMMMIE